MGCNMSLRRTVLAAVGGFDTGLGRHGDNQLGCEETELCIRAGQLFPDGVFLHEPAAVVHHHVPGQRASWRYFRDRCRAEGISKAGVARRVGRSAALASEAGYVRRVLPTGVLTNLGRSLHGDLAGVARAGAIVAGLGLTATGFLSARWAPRRRYRPGSPPISQIELPHAEPVLPLVIDLAAPLPTIDPRRGDEPPYERALCLVTVGGRPVGKVQLALDEAVLAPELVGARLRHGLGPAVDLSSVGGGPSAHPPADATVVIATRERPERLAECLRSVFAGSLQPERVVVVDNAPDDHPDGRAGGGAVRDRAAAALRPGGPARSGPRPQRGPAARADPGRRLHRRRRAGRSAVAGSAGRRASPTSDVACVTGMIAPRELDTLPQQWVEGNATYDKGLQRRVFDTGAHRPADPLFPYTAGVFGSGANMAFRTDYLRRRRGFDAALGTGTVAMGGDDLAAFYDVVSDGHRLVYEPGAIVLHQHYRDYAALRRQTYGYGAGLGAHLTRCLIDDPRFAFALRAVRGHGAPPGPHHRAAPGRRRPAGVPGRSEPAAAARPDVGSRALSPQPSARPPGGGMTVSDCRAHAGSADHRSDPGAALPLGQRHPGRHVRAVHGVPCPARGPPGPDAGAGLPADHRAAAAGRPGHGSAAAAPGGAHVRRRLRRLRRQRVAAADRPRVWRPPCTSRRATSAGAASGWPRPGSGCRC